MADPAFRADQHTRLHEPHIAPLTNFIDAIREQRGWTPYIAPLHGGINARVLYILRDPGDRTKDDGKGSGMICAENDDQTAAMVATLIEGAGVSENEVVPWNAVPWYIDNRKPTNIELRAAAPTLVSLLELLPKLEVVVLHGGEARIAWQYALEAQPTLRRRRLITIETYHASVSALQSADPIERQRRIDHRMAAWRDAGEILRG